MALDRIEKGDVEVSETAARDFLRQRCAVSLAQADRGSREHERLSEALVSDERVTKLMLQSVTHFPTSCPNMYSAVVTTSMTAYCRTCF